VNGGRCGLTPLAAAEFRSAGCAGGRNHARRSTPAVMAEAGANPGARAPRPPDAVGPPRAATFEVESAGTPKDAAGVAGAKVTPPTQRRRMVGQEAGFSRFWPPPRRIAGSSAGLRGPVVAVADASSSRDRRTVTYSGTAASPAPGVGGGSGMPGAVMLGGAILGAAMLPERGASTGESAGPTPRSPVRGGGGGCGAGCWSMVGSARLDGGA
jgi:hypothetical protein